MRLLIGYGNPLRCDDGVGWFLADQLTAIAHNEAVRIVAAHQLSPEHVDDLRRAREVLFVDAALGDEAGSWTVQPVQPQPHETPSALAHHLSPAALLTLTQALYGCAPTARIVTVVGADFGFGEAFSPAVEAAIPAVQQYIAHFLCGVA